MLLSHNWKVHLSLSLSQVKLFQFLEVFLNKNLQMVQSFLKKKYFLLLNQKKIHKKADEINIFIEDKKWLNKIEKTTRLEIVVAPNMFCLVIFILEYLTQKHSETEN